MVYAYKRDTKSRIVRPRISFTGINAYKLMIMGEKITMVSWVVNE